MALHPFDVAGKASMLTLGNQKGSRLFFAIAVLLFGAALVVRLQSPDDFPAANNEYYSSTAVSRILEYGVARYECGGVYDRSPLFHYTGAALVRIGAAADPLDALRLVSLLASLALFPAVVLVALRLGNPPAALIAGTLLLFSMWEIEFARFARMYALFACLSTWQVYLSIRYAETTAFRHLLGAVVLAGLATLTWAGGPFLFSTPAIAWWLSGRWPKAHEIAAVALPLAAVAAFRILDTGGGGEEALASTGSSLLIHPFEGRRNPGGVVLVLVLVALGLAGAYRLAAGRGLSVRQHWPLAPGVLLLVGFGATGLLIPAAVMVLLLALTAASAALPARWKIYAAAYLAICAVLHLGLEVAAGASIPEGLTSLAGYPDVWIRFLQPWWWAMPAWTVVLAAANGVAALLAIRSRASLPLRMLIAVTTVLITLTTMVRTDYVATRYTFFLYPLCLIGLIVPLAFVLDRVRRTAAQWAAGVAAVAIFFGISSDHDVAELTKVGTYEHVFRLNMPDARAHQLYKRYDYPSAGRFLANQASDADRIMLTHPGQSSGVDRFDFVYRSNPVEYQRTRCSSGIDQWTGKPLLGTKEQLLAVAGELGADEALWLVDYVKDPVFTPEEMAALGPSLASEAVYQTPDRQLQVIRIARSGSPASGPGNAPSEPVVSDLGEVSSAL